MTLFLLAEQYIENDYYCWSEKYWYVPLHRNERDLLGNLCVYGAPQKQPVHKKHQ